VANIANLAVRAEDLWPSQWPECLSDVNDESVISTPRQQSTSGETMVSRIASQLYSDADKVRRLIAEYASVDEKQVIDEAHLIDDLGLDWLDQLELLVLIEDEFAGVELFNTTAGQLELVGQLIRKVEQRNAVPIRRSAA
jgi:acyl carrier protein